MLADNFKGEYYVGQNILNKYVQAIFFIWMIKWDKENKAFLGWVENKMVSWQREQTFL